MVSSRVCLPPTRALPALVWPDHRSPKGMVFAIRRSPGFQGELDACRAGKASTAGAPKFESRASVAGG